MKTLYMDLGPRGQNQFNLNGFNLTVRKGLKWFNDLGVGDKFQIVDAEDTLLGYGTVHLIAAGLFGSIPLSILGYEHNPQCRTLEGLKAVLDEVYPEPVSMSDEVTLILFFYERD